MKRSTGHPFALVFLLLASVLGLFLRWLQLTRVFDSDGLPTTGHPLTLGLSIYCVVVVVAIAVFCLRLPKRKTAQAVYRRSRVSTATAAAAGVLLLVACLLRIVQSLLGLHGTSQQFLSALSILVDVFGFVSALCILAAAAKRYTGRKSNAALYIVPFLYIMCRLVLDFKSWSSDPIILDYCFQLFALICTMSGAYRIGGFCFDEGRRRLTAFWSMAGVFFSIVAMPGSEVGELYFYFATALWMFSITWMALRAVRDPAPPQQQAEGQANKPAEGA